MALPSTKKWFLYPSARSALRAGDIDLNNDSFKAMLLSGSHTFSAGHSQRSDVSGDALGTDQAVTVGLSVSSGLYTISLDSSPSWAGGVAPRYVAIYDDTDANDALLGIYDNGAAQTIPGGWTFNVATGTIAVSNTNTNSPSDSVLHPNEPAGYSELAYADGSVIWGDQSGSGGESVACFNLPNGYHFYNGAPPDSHGNMALVDDASNPTGSGKAIRLHYNPSYNGCTSTDIRLPTHPSEIYIAFRVIIETGWYLDGHGHKWWYIDQTGLSSPSHGPISTHEADDKMYGFNCDIAPGGTTSNMLITAAGALGDRDSEYLIEWVIKAPSSIGVYDAYVQAWINNSEIGSVNDVNFNAYTYTDTSFDNLHLYWKTNAFTQDSYMRLRELYVSGVS